MISLLWQWNTILFFRKSEIISTEFLSVTASLWAPFHSGFNRQISEEFESKIQGFNVKHSRIYSADRMFSSRRVSITWLKLPNYLSVHDIFIIYRNVTLLFYPLKVTVGWISCKVVNVVPYLSKYPNDKIVFWPLIWLVLTWQKFKAWTWYSCFYPDKLFWMQDKWKF